KDAPDLLRLVGPTRVPCHPERSARRVGLGLAQDDKPKPATQIKANFDSMYAIPTLRHGVRQRDKAAAHITSADGMHSKAQVTSERQQTGGCAYMGSDVVGGEDTEVMPVADQHLFHAHLFEYRELA